MDEFHSFNDPERGIVWELSLGLLPPHVRTLLLSATVGNSVEFTSWLMRSCNRRLQLVQSTDRKVPLSFQWVGDHTLDEWIEKMVEGSTEARRTPALIFCFNRDECWQVAELLKGKRVVDKPQQALLSAELEKYDWSQGAGPKLKQILQRGVGVHHAGVLPKYRRIVEDLFQAKLLSVAVCTETLSAGINLPARSVVLPTILKGPKDKRKVIEPSCAANLRAGWSTSVRQRRLCLCAGTRRRRQVIAVARKVRFDSGGHERSRLAARQEAAQEENAASA